MKHMDDIWTHAAALVAQLQLGAEWPSSSMSISVYDTAWVSMVAKNSTNGEERRWLFPAAFVTVLDMQHPDGYWGLGMSPSDGILNTMAALLALLEHKSHDNYLGCPPPPTNITVRISKAIIWLGSQLEGLDTSTCVDSVAFELLVPALLGFLAVHGVTFEFPQLDHLLDLAEKKLPKRNPELLYSGNPTTILHSLEAIADKVDFDRLSSAKMRGSMLGSPSSTAIYLMRSSTWDAEAETYLRHAFEQGAGRSSGGFPSAYPIEIFEISWVLSTLLESGIPLHALGSEHVAALSSHLSRTLTASGGTLGFSAEMLPDVDDTAKTLHMMALVGQEPVDPERMNAEFWTPSSFKTYQGEQTSSISANANVLKALLSTQRPQNYATHILTATEFICNAWSTGKLVDKWNTAPEYSAMLVSQALSRLLQVHEEYGMDALPGKLLKLTVPMALTQITCRLLHAQNANGSFGDGSHEVTAYSVLALSAVIPRNSLTAFICEDVTAAIAKAKDFLQPSFMAWKPQKLWIEKVTYSSDLLSTAYCLSAMNAALTTNSRPTRAAVPKSDLLSLFGVLPLFSHMPSRDRTLRLALQESTAFLPFLKAIRTSIFPRTGMANEKYLNVIPLAWVACDYMSPLPLVPNLLLEMMEISMFNYQADEYLETALLGSGEREIRFMRNIVDLVCGNLPVEPPCALSVDQPSRKRKLEHHSSDLAPQSDDVPSQSTLGSTQTILLAFVHRVLDSPFLVQASSSRRKEVQKGLTHYLHAQITSVVSRTQGYSSVNEKSFFDWVHTDGSYDTSCPYSFAYFTCLVSESSSNRAISRSSSSDEPTEIQLFEEEYLLKEVCSRLSVICRLYNDYGSTRRDFEEGNLNSVDFIQGPKGNTQNGHNPTPKQNGVQTNGHQSGGSNGHCGESTLAAKQALLYLAGHERECMKLALEKLQSSHCGLGERFLARLEIIINVTDLFGQIYAVRDIGTRVKQENMEASKHQ
ncbi:hypothetical protein BCR34DRAFT_590903 [Clohesyomyces aquaticus]|uniref:Ent-kaurene synthase n=1 Tax=Clohesyomyces aquaticus TaxID=1231657 RepID=A0A1Y1Z5G3_9PLEO|nr:hypothetical protein BCR34DRAFT_590903 [Clohesyomyces aquaticus]